MVKEYPWNWTTPRKPSNVTIGLAEEGRFMVNGKVCLLDNGDLLAWTYHFSGASDAVITYSRVLWFVSHDGGMTWKKLNERPAGVCPIEDSQEQEYVGLPVKLSDGTLLSAGSFGYDSFRDTKEKREELAGKGFLMWTPEEGNAPGTISIIYRALMKSSNNGGKTWEKSEIKLPVFLTHLCAYGDPVLTRHGTFVQPMYGRFDLKKEPKYGSSLALRTVDGGENWSVHTVAKASQGPNDFNFSETAITEAPNGDLVAVMRTTEQRELWGAISNDDGSTWQEPHDTGLRGSTPALVTTKDGIVVAVYARRSTFKNSGGFNRTGMYACVSRDNGQSWDTEHQVVLRDTGNAQGPDYPTAVALPDGSVYTVYGLMLPSAFAGTRFHPCYEDFGRAG